MEVKEEEEEEEGEERCRSSERWPDGQEDLKQSRVDLFWFLKISSLNNNIDPGHRLGILMFGKVNEFL